MIMPFEGPRVPLSLETKGRHIWSRTDGEKVSDFEKSFSIAEDLP
jgi:hypothetical protein